MLHFGLLVLEAYGALGVFENLEIPLPVGFETLFEALNVALGPRILKIYTNHHIGLLVELLWLFGASRNQAIQAVAQWYKISETKTKNAKMKLSVERKSLDIIFLLFLGYNRELVRFLKGEESRPFPLCKGSYPKAAKAFQLIRRITEENAPYFERKQRPQLSAYLEIKKRILELCPDYALTLKNVGTLILPRYFENA